MRARARVCVCLCVCVRVWAYVCACACVRACVHVCVCMRIRVGNHLVIHDKHAPVQGRRQVNQFIHQPLTGGEWLAPKCVRLYMG